MIPPDEPTKLTPDQQVELLGTADAATFAELVEPHRRELRVHCYRMLASYEDAQDMVQETFLRAWRRRETFQGRAPIRAWLYRIATNACLDFLDRRPERGQVAVTDGNVGIDVPWLQPAPDDALVATTPDPDQSAITKETIELAFLVAVQHLPARQRAVLILRDVLGWPARDTAAALEVSVASANSALQRARSTMRTHLPESRMRWRLSPASDERERMLVRQYMEATERGDIGALARILHDELRFAMPPETGTITGRDQCLASWRQGGFGSPDFGVIRAVPTRANLQPAVAGYLRRPGETEFRLLAVDVLAFRDGLVSEVVAFHGPALDHFELPRVLNRTAGLDTSGWGDA